MAQLVGRVQELRRFPVKSILGELLPCVTLDERGLAGDRRWVVRNGAGKFGSGKTTRRFQHMRGLFTLRARYEGSVPVITMPDGVAYRGDDPTVHDALSRWLGFSVTLAPEADISHPIILNGANALDSGAFVL